MGVAVTSVEAGRTPVTLYAQPDATGPAVILAHGFAGSEQMMQGYALPLARAGYRVHAFEFLGHGRHPDPMSGDVTSVDGTTRLLVDQTLSVIDAIGPQDAPLALVGHSMATDILARVANRRPDVGPVVLISPFSQAVDATTPADLLLISGAWEPRLRAFALGAARMVDPRAVENQTVGADGILRRAAVAPFSEHVSVLHSRVARAETLAWLDRAYGRGSDVAILPTGWAILALLGGLVLLFRPVARVLPVVQQPDRRLSRGRLACVILLPAAVAPLVAVPLNPSFLPVLVADYLGLHLLVFGGLQLAMLVFWKVPMGRPSGRGLAVLLLGCAVFGLALDRYAANFWPTPDRLVVIAILTVGAVPFMVADAMLTAKASVLRRLALRAGFLASLGVAVALDFEGLFFLMLIAPVMILFYLVFGTMGRDTARRVGPLSSGLVLGFVLAWALGASFPLFLA